MEAFSLGPCDNQSCVKFNATTGQFNLTKMLNLSSYCAYIKKVQKTQNVPIFHQISFSKSKLLTMLLSSLVLAKQSLKPRSHGTPSPNTTLFIDGGAD